MNYFIGITRYALPVLAFIILVKCVLTLLFGHPVNKVYAYIVDTTSGEKIPLNMWETSIGKGKSCDIKLSYNTIASSQAVISRRADGWYIFDTMSRVGTKVNGEKISKRTVIKHGDKIAFADIPFVFVVADDPVITVGGRKRSTRQQKSIQNTATPVNKPQQMSNRQPVQNNAENSEQPYHFQPVYNQSFDDGNFNLKFNNKNTQNDETRKTTLKGDTLHSGQKIFTSEQSDNVKAFDTYTKPENVTAPVNTSEQMPKNEPALINVETGEIFVLCGDYIQLGRATSCDIRIAGNEVSRNHAALKKYKDGWAVLDTGSKAGTLLNGKPVTNPLLLFDGDEIKICKNVFKYTLDYKRR